MADSDSDDTTDDDFYRWFVGGSPPEADRWPRHAFENALRHGSIDALKNDDAWPDWRAASL